MSYNPNFIFKIFNDEYIDNESTHDIIKEHLESIDFETFDKSEFKNLYKKFKEMGFLGSDFNSDFEVRNLFIKRMLAHAKKLDIK